MASSPKAPELRMGEGELTNRGLVLRSREMFDEKQTNKDPDTLFRATTR